MTSEFVDTPAAERTGRWLRRAAVIGLIALIAGESGAQVVSYLFRQRAMTYDSVVGWRSIPKSELQQDAGYGPYHVAINSQGLRDDEHSFEKPDGVFRIVVLGDSVAFGYGGVEQDEIFTQILQDRLTGVEIINLGVPAFSTDQEYLYLKEHGLRYDPDLVLLCMYQDDFLPTFESFVSAIGRPKGSVCLDGKRLAFRTPEFPWYYLLVEHSILAGYVDSQFNIVRRLNESCRPKSALTFEEKTDTYKALLSAMDDLCTAHGCDLSIVYQPGYSMIPTEDHARHIATEFAHQHDIGLLDLNDSLPFQEPHAASKYSVGDDIHPNRKGHRLIAHAVQEFLADTVEEIGLFRPVSTNDIGLRGQDVR